MHAVRQAKKTGILFLILILLCLCPVSASADNSFPKSPLQEQAIPAYTEGSDYFIDINDGVPDFEVWQHTTFPFVLFSELDELGTPWKTAIFLPLAASTCDPESDCSVCEMT